ncbi:MAG: hypothetical protein JNL53_01025 [Cyclobacteriaceae bacterium]|nr:hypothetical protein [Cyclobacteriaceae bacterium]
MRLNRNLIGFLFISLGLGACFTPPEFPLQPQIEFESIVFREYGSGFDAEADSLILTLTFKDGDGDLGLDPSELSCVSEGICYNNKFFFRKPDGTLLTYKDKRTNPAYSSLPDFVKPYNCINWEVSTDNTGKVDTFYFELNPDHYNIEVDFLVKNPDGTFTEFDWTKEFNYPNCGTSFDGRFPILYKEEPGTPLEGNLRYSMGSIGFKALFSVKTLKLRVQIKDRALNKSNEIFTPEFTL